jgi:hypothetical protein
MGQQFFEAQVEFMNQLPAGKDNVTEIQMISSPANALKPYGFVQK